MAVEEVLGVDEDPLSLRAQMHDGVPDHHEVLGRGGAQGTFDVAQIRLGDQADHRGPRVPKRRHLGIVRGGAARPPGGPEGGQHGGRQVQFAARPGEELRVLRV